LNGRTAVVTGGAQGIGRGIALELASAGATVIVADLDQQRSRAVVHEIESSGRHALALSLNVASNESVQRCVANALEYFPRIGILVNNAGIFQSRLGLAVDDEEFNRCLDINLTGAWRMSRALVPHFRAHRSGKIVNIASVGGRRGVDFAPAYCASKAAMINLTQSLAAALGPDNINVNAICPGAVGTAMQDQIKALRRAPGNEAAVTIPSRALANVLTAADIGRAVAFFASDYASAITGQALNVDCGFLKY
jgi:meso-butanediol dehydrogenase / (S,S)-butanediol dehydrogenase / diacetyl reductase